MSQPFRATQRIIDMIAILHLAPRPLTVDEIMARLTRSSRTHVRTMQRDLRELSKIVPLVADRKAKPYRWRLKAKAGCPCCYRRLGSR